MIGGEGVLIALAATVLWFGGVTIVKDLQKAGHAVKNAVTKVVHHPKKSDHHK